MRVGIMGTGMLGSALGRRWVAAGHEVVIGGRSRARADELAGRLGHGASSGSLRDAIGDVDAVLLAVAWAGALDALSAVGAADGGLAGVLVVDPTNPVGHGIGKHLLSVGSAAQTIATAAPGATVVKAFNLHPAQTWTEPATSVTVPIATDDDSAAATVHELVESLGATGHRFGRLERARQLEELAGAVISLVAAGVDPHTVVPGPHRLMTASPASGPAAAGGQGSAGA